MPKRRPQQRQARNLRIAPCAGGSEAARMLSSGEHLRGEIKRLGLDQVAVSEAIGVSRQTVNNIINGRQTISRPIAGRLGRLFGKSSDYWLRRSYLRDGSMSETDPGVGVLVNHQIVRALKDGIIGIEPFDPVNVNAASIDLAPDIAAKGILLKAGRAVKLRTKERISLPADYIGRAGIANRLADRGLLLSQAVQIEPGFQGRLHFHVFNASGADIRLRAGEPIIAIEIARLGVAPMPA